MLVWVLNSAQKHVTTALKQQHSRHLGSINCKESDLKSSLDVCHVSLIMRVCTVWQCMLRHTFVLLLHITADSRRGGCNINRSLPR